MMGEQQVRENLTSFFVNLEQYLGTRQDEFLQLMLGHHSMCCTHAGPQTDPILCSVVDRQVVPDLEAMVRDRSVTLYYLALARYLDESDNGIYSRLRERLAMQFGKYLILLVDYDPLESSGLGRDLERQLRASLPQPVWEEGQSGRSSQWYAVALPVNRYGEIIVAHLCEGVRTMKRELVER